MSDLTICPNLKRFNSLNLSGKEEMIQEGYNITIDMMPQIEKLMSGKLKR